MHQLAVILASLACVGCGRRTRTAVNYAENNLHEERHNSAASLYEILGNLHEKNRHPLSLAESQDWKDSVAEPRRNVLAMLQAFNSAAGSHGTGQGKRPAVRKSSALHRHLEASMSRRAFLFPALASVLSANIFPGQSFAEEGGEQAKTLDPKGFDARFESGRIRSQSVGITQRSALLGDYTFVWGVKGTCDPLDPTCSEKGNLTGLAVQSIPPEKQKVTDRVRFDISLGRKKEGALTFGLWREAAPDAVDAFVKLSKLEYKPLPDDAPAGYRGASLVKIQNDRFIQFGSLQQTGGSTKFVRGVSAPQTVPCAPPVTSDKPNGISHDAAGYLSVRKGGGSFDFSITTRANPDLDRDNIVIGELTDEDSMRLLERLNILPVNKYSGGGPLANVDINRVQVL